MRDVEQLPKETDIRSDTAICALRLWRANHTDKSHGDSHGQPAVSCIIPSDTRYADARSEPAFQQLSVGNILNERLGKTALAAGFQR